MFRKIVKKLPFVGGNTLYYSGCLTKFKSPELELRYERILQKMEVDYITIPEFNCCGIPVLNAGYDTDFYELSQKNKDIFKEYNIKRIITNCPSCAVSFGQIYNIKTLHITQVIAKNLSYFKQVTNDEPVCYHDPCNLSRKCKIIDEPRKILSHLGFEIIEMAHSKQGSLCCGAGGGLSSNNPSLTSKIADLRLDQCRTKKLITTCPSCYANLKAHAKGIKVMELSEVLDNDK